MATVGACTGFAAASGSGFATAAAIGSVTLPEMKRYGYSDSLATGAVASGGTIGILIPPSIPFIIYGMLTDESVGKLFAAGIFPGLLEAASYFAVIYIIAKVMPKAAPRGPSFAWRERLLSLRNFGPVLALFGLVMGSIYLGVATPTEAAALGCLGSFIFVIVNRQFSLKVLYSSVRRTAVICVMLMTIFMGTMVFSSFLATSGVTNLIANWLVSLPLPPIGIVVVIMLMYIPLGCVMESMAMMVLTVPIFMPVLHSLGFSLIWFGVLAVRAIEIGEITPPLGINVFVIKGVAKDVPMGTIFKGILSFLAADLICLPLLIFFPQISLFLPGFIK
jgi:tripartite ATP-independent transporter DctM subunit